MEDGLGGWSFIVDVMMDLVTESEEKSCEGRLLYD